MPASNCLDSPLFLAVNPAMAKTQPEENTDDDLPDEQPAEQYAFDEPTPADTVLRIDGQAYIDRFGMRLIPVGCGATCVDEIPTDSVLDDN